MDAILVSSFCSSLLARVALKALSLCRGWPRSSGPRQVLHFGESQGISESWAEGGTGLSVRQGRDRGVWLATSTTNCLPSGAGKGGEPMA